MKPIIKADKLNKKYGQKTVLNNLNFEIAQGQIVGLLGPNGAGKTTLLKTLLGLAPYSGKIEVMGLDPYKDRVKMMQHMCFIADVAILPHWLSVKQALDFVEGVHPKFSREQAEGFLAKTDIPKNAKVKTLSKGMVVQLHLALIMAIDVEILILDEPTLGLDILYRKTFYRNLLNDYFHDQRTIIVTTHQIEEIEHILTDLMMINHGELVLHDSIEHIQKQFTLLTTTPEKAKNITDYTPLSEQTQLGEVQLIFDGVPAEALTQYGEVKPAPLSDLFVAKMQGAKA